MDKLDMLNKLDTSLSDFSENVNNLVSNSSADFDSRHAIDALAHETFNALDDFREIISLIIENM